METASGSSIAELYDPASGAFSRTGHLTSGRLQHSTTLLPDGGVLFAGGYIIRGDSAEIYNPREGSFSRTASMTVAREGHTATLLNDGRVLIAGGNHPLSGAISSSADLYTPGMLIPAPVLFSLSSDGLGQGAIWHAETGQIASPGNPAIAGEALSMYTTSLVDGGGIPPQISVGGRLAEVLYFGLSGYTGYNQVNFRVPGGVAPAPAVPVRLTYLNRSEQRGHHRSSVTAAAWGKCDGTRSDSGERRRGKYASRSVAHVAWRRFLGWGGFRQLEGQSSPFYACRQPEERNRSNRTTPPR